MKLPPLVGIFPAQFPGFGSYGNRNHVGPNEEPCDMAFHLPGSPCMSARYLPVGVAGIDHDGRCWVLVSDYALTGGNADGSWKTMHERLRWVVFPTEVGE